MKKSICFLLTVSTLVCYALAAPISPELAAPSAILIEKETGTVLYEKESHTLLPPASVTKVMTLLLVMESIESGKISFNDIVTVSEYAAGMGGSQVFLSPGEQMSVHELLKATVVSSGNDSAVALAEHIAGSEASFVGMMNQKARDLGMADTTFKNCTGLDTEGHVTSANDISVMSRELIKHDKIKEYTKIWIDSIRNGEFQLANTNKLIRTYKGITGLKTGSTSISKFCLSATAERDGMELIAVIMAAPTGKERFSDAAKLLDAGFANYSLYNGVHDTELPHINVILGNCEGLSLDYGLAPKILIEKDKIQKITSELSLPEDVKAPVEKGQKVGTLKFFCNEEMISEVPIIAAESVKRLSLSGIFAKLFSVCMMK